MPVKGAGPGRPKGSKNKFTSFKADLIKAWEEANGYKNMLKWMRDEKNIRDVVTVMAKLLPKDVILQGDEENPVITEIVIKHVKADTQPTGKDS